MTLNKKSYPLLYSLIGGSVLVCVLALFGFLEMSSAATLHAPTAPILSVTPPTLTFHAQINGFKPPGRPITITNTGSGDLSPMAWTATTDAAWLELAGLTIGGLFPNESAVITATVNIAGLDVAAATL